jgi:hypothetical protein
MNGTAGTNARAVALDLAEDLLADIELGRISASQVALKTSRLARLLDDVVSVQWLQFEVSGYPMRAGGLDPDVWVAAERSNRTGEHNGKPWAWTSLLGQIEANIEASLAQLATAGDPPVSLNSANPNQFVMAPKGNADERSLLRNHVSEQRALRDKVLGAMYAYVRDRYQELRFGSAVETAFTLVRRDVDRAISDLVPEALPMLSAAFENATSGNAEHWANAASTCRRLLKAVADRLQPSGDDVGSINMGLDNYINRLVHWITQQTPSGTFREVVTTDLEYLGRRLDAVDGAGHKGAHANVTQFDASRFLTATYLLLVDVLALYEPVAPHPSPGEAGESLPAELSTSPDPDAGGPPSVDAP